MKIRQLSKLALAVALSSAIMFEGCQKYDDDITRLEQGIEQNSSDIASLKSQLANLAANWVIDGEPTSVSGGFKIKLKGPNGQTQEYTIVNGEDGAAGVGSPGTDGTNGTNGKNGTIWRINPTSLEWEYKNDADTDWQSTGILAKGLDGKDGVNGQDGTDGVDGKDGVNGQDGRDGVDGKDGVNGQDGRDGVDGIDGINGQNGSVVTIETVGSKQYWHIDGQNTNVQAYFGEITMVATSGGYNVVFTDATGGASDSIFLATEAV